MRRGLTVTALLLGACVEQNPEWVAGVGGETTSVGTEDTDETGDVADCGNGVIDPGEQCDGDNLAGLDCGTLNAGGGELTCSTSCELDISACSSCRNVLTNPSTETGDLAGWDVLQNGGDGYQVVDDANAPDGQRVVITSFGDFRRGQEVDLLEAGFDADRLDANPGIRAELWVRETFDPDHWWIHVELRDASHQAITTWDDDDWTGGIGGSYEDDTWFQVAHTFETVPPGVRYVYFEDGGVDGEFWEGNFGVVLDAAALIVCD